MIPFLFAFCFFLRAYKFADFDGSGLISKREFRTLLDALSFFQAQWLKFESIDRDGDLSMDITEFVNDRSTLGLGDLSVRQAEDVVSVEGLSSIGNSSSQIPFVYSSA